MRTLIRSAVALVALVALAGSAFAEEEFDVALAPGKVTVKAKGDWHINKAYPWKLTIGDKQIPAGEFALSEQSASVSAPKGTGKLKGGVCNGDQCRMFQVEVNVP